MNSHEDKYIQDLRSSEEIVAKYRCNLDTDDSDTSLATVHFRGGADEFSLGKKYAQSNDPLDRVTGTHVLAQLGWNKRAFLTESMDILIQLLDDSDERVVAAAAGSLGHRNDPRCIPHVLPLIHHASAEVRSGVVSALSSHEDAAAIGGLVELSKDADHDVRNWAAFGLGTLADSDSEELRDALLRLLNDEDAEIRGEALIGLAKRKDLRVLEPLKRELTGEFHGNWSLEAAELLRDPSLLPLLSVLERRITNYEDLMRFQADLTSAIQACTR